MVELSTKTSAEQVTKIKTVWEESLEADNYLSEDQRGKTNFVLFDE